MCIYVYVHIYKYPHIFTKIDVFLNGEVQTVCAYLYRDL